MRSITIGITTHNEAAHIASLLDELMAADPERVKVIIYDDASSDSTMRIIQAHPLTSRDGVLVFGATSNFGGPAPGRQFIADMARTDYVTLVDGDDLIDLGKLMDVLDRIDRLPLFDMVVTPFDFLGRLRKINAPSGPVAIDGKTVTRLLSGIGGKIYRTEVLATNICHQYVGRSDDARLNLRALLAGHTSIFHVDDVCFYRILAPRKSRSAHQIRLDELHWRINAYKELSRRHDLDDSYLIAVRNNFLRVIADDTNFDPKHGRELSDAIKTLVPLTLRRIVFLADDASRIGGVPARIRQTLAHSGSRAIEYAALTLKNAGGAAMDRVYCCAESEAEVLAQLAEWRPHDTVVITQSANLLFFPPAVRRRIQEFPIIFFGDAQLAYFLQYSNAMEDPAAADRLRVSRIVALSDGDIQFQRQLGIVGQVKGFIPVEQRSTNHYDPAGPLVVGYVGVSDFKAKATDRLVEIALALRAAGFPPLKVFTTDAGNSPDYGQLTTLLEASGAIDHCEVTLNESEKEAIFSKFSVLVVPSKQESAGLAILEAFSFGIPVIASSAAPGPSELIADGENGFLLDEFTADGVVELLRKLDPPLRARMSARAFERHRNYDIERYLEFIEDTSRDTLNNYFGVNRLRVLPEIRAITRLTTSIAHRDAQIAQLKKLTERRMIANPAAIKAFIRSVTPRPLWQLARVLRSRGWLHHLGFPAR